jgi:transcriptional regulator with PAS, ATPase and Fis domain
MDSNNWIKEFPAAITVCDKEGIIISMNDASAKVFEKDGGMDLIGSNLYDCHPGTSSDKLRELMENEKVNTYSIEKNGQKKLIYQSPWYENGEYKGFVEISIPLPFEMKHFIRE